MVACGANIASKDMDDLVAPGEGVCYYLTPSQIDNGIIAEDLPEMRELPRKTQTVEEGDLILMRTGATSKIAIYECACESMRETPVRPACGMQPLLKGDHAAS